MDASIWQQNVNPGTKYFLRKRTPEETPNSCDVSFKALIEKRVGYRAKNQMRKQTKTTNPTGLTEPIATNVGRQYHTTVPAKLLPHYGRNTAGILHPQYPHAVTGSI